MDTVQAYFITKLVRPMAIDKKHTGITSLEKLKFR